MGTFMMVIKVGGKAHRETFLELLVITLISVSPLLLGALIRWVQVENEHLSVGSYVAALDTFLARGELFLYALAFIAVVAWTALREWPQGLRPPRILLGLFCFISYGIICTFYSLDITKVALHLNAVLIGSKIMFIVTLLFYYLTTLLSKIETPDLAAVLAGSSGALSVEIQRSREHD